MPTWLLGGAGLAALAAAGYLGLVTGAVPVDVGVGRRLRPLGPLTIAINAPREVVFDVISQPYLGRATRAMREKVRVLHAGSDMVLAAHHTPIRGRLVATTVETVPDDNRRCAPQWGAVIRPPRGDAHVTSYELRRRAGPPHGSLDHG